MTSRRKHATCAFYRPHKRSGVRNLPILLKNRHFALLSLLTQPGYRTKTRRMSGTLYEETHWLSWWSHTHFNPKYKQQIPESIASKKGRHQTSLTSHNRLYRFIQLLFGATQCPWHHFAYNGSLLSTVQRQYSLLCLDNIFIFSWSPKKRYRSYLQLPDTSLRCNGETIVRETLILRGEK